MTDSPNEISPRLRQDPFLRGPGAGLGLFSGLFFAHLLMAVFFSIQGCTNVESNAGKGLSEPILRVGTTMAVKQANPVADYYYNILAMVMTHDSLVRFDEDLKPVPQLASGYAASSDGRTWTFDLNPKARWHDGRPVTPDDVKFTFSYLGKHHVSGGFVGRMIDRVETHGQRVVFHLKAPCSRFLINGGFVVRILPRHIWENIQDPHRTEDPGVAIGCGPYRLDNFDRSAGTVRFRRNPDYYGPVPETGRVDFRTFGTMDLLALALMKGRTDLYYQYAAGMPPPYMKRLRQESRLSYMTAASMGIPAVLGFNLESPRAGALPVRRAIALAIDYSQINAALMGGKGMIPSPSLVPPSFSFQAHRASWTRDLQKSRELLASNGWLDRDKDGIRESPGKVPAVFTLLVRSDLWGEKQLVKLLTGDFEKVGLALRVRSADLSTYLAFLKKGAYDLVLFRTTPWGMMMHAGCGTGYFDAPKTGSLNMCRMEDETFRGLCQAVLETVDPDRQNALYERIQAYYAERLPAIALCWGRSFFPYDRAWQGFLVNQLEGGLANRFSWRHLKPSDFQSTRGR